MMQPALKPRNWGALEGFGDQMEITIDIQWEMNSPKHRNWYYFLINYLWSIEIGSRWCPGRRDEAKEEEREYNGITFVFGSLQFAAYLMHSIEHFRTSLLFCPRSSASTCGSWIAGGECPAAAQQPRAGLTSPKSLQSHIVVFTPLVCENS